MCWRCVEEWGSRVGCAASNANAPAATLCAVGCVMGFGTAVVCVERFGGMRTQLTAAVCVTSSELRLGLRAGVLRDSAVRMEPRSELRWELTAGMHTLLTQR
eukprot:3940886-Rhodomonas_salina.1